GRHRHEPTAPTRPPPPGLGSPAPATSPWPRLPTAAATSRRRPRVPTAPPAPRRGRPSGSLASLQSLLTRSSHLERARHRAERHGPFSGFVGVFAFLCRLRRR